MRVCESPQSVRVVLLVNSIAIRPWKDFPDPQPRLRSPDAMLRLPCGRVGSLIFVCVDFAAKPRDAMTIRRTESKYVNSRALGSSRSGTLVLARSHDLGVLHNAYRQNVARRRSRGRSKLSAHPVRVRCKYDSSLRRLCLARCRPTTFCRVETPGTAKPTARVRRRLTRPQ